MIKEIKRNVWSKFCKNFSSDNQYRWMSVYHADKWHDEGNSIAYSPFIGLSIEKKGRLIDGIRLFAGWSDPEQITHPVITIKEPEKVTVEKDSDGQDQRLIIKSKAGHETTIDLTGTKDFWQQHEFVEKIAYSLYERRGYRHGDDWGDWLKAENLVKQAEEQFV